MIEFYKINIEGFCSIPKLSLDLNIKGFTLIKAPNGYGKSTLFSALIWCIYGKNLKGTSSVNTWEKYRTKEYLGTKVEVYFKADSKTCKITRCLNYKGEVNGSKGLSRLLFEIDAEEVKEKSKVKIQDIIQETVGLSYNLFLNSVMFGQGLKRLIQESTTDQKKIFEEVFDVTYLNDARTVAQNKLNNSLESYNDINSLVKGLELKKQAAKNQLKELKNLQKDSIFNLDHKIALKQKELKVIDQKLEGVSIEKLSKNLEKLENNSEKLSSSISSLEKLIRSAKDQSNISLKEFIDKIISLLDNKKYKTALKTLTSLKDLFISIDENTQKSISLKEQLNSLKSEQYNKRIQISSYKNLEKDRNKLKNEIEDLKGESNVELDNSINKCKSQIKEIRTSIRQHIPQLSVLENNTRNYRWAYSEAFGNNGIKAFLFESSLNDINKTLESYSDILGFLIQFKIDTSSARKDFITTITMEGIRVDYDDLSGGQKQLVNLAMAFAMNEVVYSLKGINITFLDEVFESLSEDNIEIVVTLLRHIYKDRSLFLITHLSSLPLGNSRLLKVSRIKGLSYYEL